MTENKIASRQVGFILFSLILGSAVIYMPEAMAGRDAWISTILAAPLGMYVLWIIITVQNMFPRKNMLEICELVLGQVTGKIINVFYIWLLFMVAAFYLYDLTAFLYIILIDLEKTTIYGLVILVVAYCVYQGVNAIARLVELLVWIIPFLFSLAFLILLICCSDFSHLTPVLAHIQPVLAGSLYTANWPFAQVSVLIIYLSFVTDLPAKQKVIYIWYIIAALVMVARSMLTIAVLGEEITLFARFPFYEALQLMQMTEFRRLELFFFPLLFITAFFALLLSYQGLLMGIQKIFNLKDIRYLILPVGLLLMVLTSYMFPSDLEVLYLETLVPFSMLPIHVLYPSLIFVAAKVYKKRNGTPVVS